MRDHHADSCCEQLKRKVLSSPYVQVCRLVQSLARPGATVMLQNHTGVYRYMLKRPSYFRHNVYESVFSQLRVCILRISKQIVHAPLTKR